MAAAAVIAAIGTALGVVGGAVGPILSKRKSDKEAAQLERLELTKQLQLGNVPGASTSSSSGTTGVKSFVEENKTVILIALSALSVLFIFKQNFSK
jgi:hypothetical protein